MLVTDLISAYPMTAVLLAGVLCALLATWAAYGEGKESGFSRGEQEGYDRGYKDGERAHKKELKQDKEALAA